MEKCAACFAYNKFYCMEKNSKDSVAIFYSDRSLVLSTGQLLKAHSLGSLQ